MSLKPALGRYLILVTGKILLKVKYAYTLLATVLQCVRRLRYCPGSADLWDYGI